jgi:hypothetical protein
LIAVWHKIIGGNRLLKNDFLSAASTLARSATHRFFIPSGMKHVLYFLLLFSLLMTAGRLFAQIPQDIPHQTDPVDFTSQRNILFYLGVPLLMIVLYILIRKVRRSRDEP